MSARDKIRSLTLGQAAKFRSEVVNIDGVDFEVRQPSIAGRSTLLKMAGVKADTESAQNIDITRMQVLVVIHMTYVPGTNERVFDAADEAALCEYPTGSFVDQLAAVGMRLLNVKVEETAAKN